MNESRGRKLGGDESTAERCERAHHRQMVVARPDRLLHSRAREVAVGVSDIVAGAGGVRAACGEVLVDEHDRGVFGEERRIGGGMEVDGEDLGGPARFEQRIADDGEAFAGAVCARSFEIRSGVSREAESEERPQFVRVDAECEHA